MEASGPGGGLCSVSAQLGRVETLYSVCVCVCVCPGCHSRCQVPGLPAPEGFNHLPLFSGCDTSETSAQFQPAGLRLQNDRKEEIRRTEQLGALVTFFYCFFTCSQSPVIPSSLSTVDSNRKLGCVCVCEITDIPWPASTSCTNVCLHIKGLHPTVNLRQ